MSLSYVIGFTAAFIGFGVMKTTFEPVAEPAAVAQTSLTVLPASEEAIAEHVSLRATGVRYNENLYAIVNDTDILIAADDAYGEGIGFFHSVASFELVADGNKIAFCIYETEEATSCTDFTYDVNLNSVSKAPEEVTES